MLADVSAAPSQRARAAMLALRYGLPAALLVAGAAIAVAGGDALALEGGLMFAGAGIALLLMNVLFRAGLGDHLERDREEAARRFLEEHGRWPDEDELDPASNGR